MPKPESGDVLSVARSKLSVYVRVRGLGSMNNSKTLQEFAASEVSRGRKRFFFDLSQCDGMDSTFMGTLLGIGSQIGNFKRVVILNPTSHSLNQLTTLGLHDLLLVKQNTKLPKNLELHPLIDVLCSQKDLMEHIYEAHKTLCKLDKRNKSKFKAFLTGLASELEKK